MYCFCDEDCGYDWSIVLSAFQGVCCRDFWGFLSLLEVGVGSMTGYYISCGMVGEKERMYWWCLAVAVVASAARMRASVAVGFILVRAKVVSELGFLICWDCSTGLGEEDGVKIRWWV